MISTPEYLVARFPTKQAAIDTALRMVESYHQIYEICVDDGAFPDVLNERDQKAVKSSLDLNHGHRHDQIVFSATVALVSLILGILIGCIAAGMTAGIIHPLQW